MRIIAELSVCGDCLQFLANGPNDLESDVAAACAAGVEREGGHVVPSCPEGCEGGFSRSPCQLCLSPLGGDRHAATVLEPEPAPVYGLLVRYRPYRCRNCGHVHDVQTNHTGPLNLDCPSCSWKPSSGPHVIRSGPDNWPHRERPHLYAGEAVRPDEINPHARKESNHV